MPGGSEGADREHRSVEEHDLLAAEERARIGWIRVDPFVRCCRRCCCANAIGAFCWRLIQPGSWRPV